MNKLLERCKLLTLTQERIENPNRPITSSMIELVIKILHKEKTRPRWLHWLHVCALKGHLPNSPTCLSACSVLSFWLVFFLSSLPVEYRT